MKICNFDSTNLNIMSTLRIPQEHIDSFLTYISFSPNEKRRLINAIGQYDGEFEPEKIVNFLLGKVDINRVQITQIVTIYFSLVNSLNKFENDADTFIELLKESILDAINPKEHPFDFSTFNVDVKDLLQSNSAFVNKAKVLDLMIENPRNFLDINTFHDLRTKFSELGEVEYSAIIHSLKFTVREGNKDKDIFIYLDDSDLKNIQEKIRTAIETSNQIKKNFQNANIIEI